VRPPCKLDRRSKPRSMSRHRLRRVGGKPRNRNEMNILISLDLTRDGAISCTTALCSGAGPDGGSHSGNSCAEIAARMRFLPRRYAHAPRAEAIAGSVGFVQNASEKQNQPAQIGAISRRSARYGGPRRHRIPPSQRNADKPVRPSRRAVNEGAESLCMA
jgi:hypothetical protein